MPAIDNFRWNQRTLNIVFASSSVVLLLSVYFMMKQDQADEWRDVQRTNFAIEAEIRAADLKAIETPEFKQQVAELDAKVKDSEKKLEESRASQKELFDRQAAEQLDVERLEIDLKFKNSERDEARANYDLAVRDALPEEISSERFQEAQRRQAICDETQLKLDEARTKLDKTSAEVKAITAEYDQAVAALEKMKFEAGRVETSLENIRPTKTLSKWKRAMMELPIIDGFNSHLRIVQDWIPQLRQTLGMAKIARFDRCRTCHLNIDKTTATGGAAFPPGHPETNDLTDWVRKKQFPQPYSTIRIQICSARLQAHILCLNSAARFATTDRVPVRASAMQNIRLIIQTNLLNGIMSEAIIPIISGSTRCSLLGLPSQPVSSATTA